MNPQFLTDYALAHRLAQIRSLTDDEQAIINEACRRFSRPEPMAGARGARVVTIDEARMRTLHTPLPGVG